MPPLVGRSSPTGQENVPRLAIVTEDWAAARHVDRLDAARARQCPLGAEPQDRVYAPALFVRRYEGRNLTTTDTVSQSSLEVGCTETLMKLAGPHGELFGEVTRSTGANVNLRGNTMHLSGPPEAIELARRFLVDAVELVSRGHEVRPQDVVRSVRGLRANPDASLSDLLEEIIVVHPKRRPIVPKTPAQRAYVSMIRAHDLTFGIGPAGTGKTYLAMAMATSWLVHRRVKRIVLTRPAVEAGEKLGFLPGDLAEKVNPYLRPLYDALHDMIEFEKVDQMRERGQIEVAPLAFMRGRTLNDSFVILDEAQNATSEQMRMFLTRLGYGSKAVVTGDITQTDLPAGARSGLREARSLLAEIEGIGFQTFSDADVVRHELVQRIIVAYERRDAELAAAREQRETSATAGSAPSVPVSQEPDGRS